MLLVLAGLGLWSGHAAAFTCTSAGGNWATVGTWSGCNGTIPQPGDTVVITAGTVVLNTNSTISGLTLSGGILNIGNSTLVRTLTVNGNISVAGGATVRVNNSAATYQLNVSGNITNNGTFDLYLDGNSFCAANFTGAGTHTIDGTSAGTTEFYNLATTGSLTINKTAGAAVTQTGTLSVAGALTVQAGTYNLANTAAVTGTTSVSGTLGITSATGTKTFTGAVTVNPGGIWSNTANEAVSMGSNLANSGTFTSGTGTYTFTGATQWTGGSLTFAGPVVANNNLSVNVSGTVAQNGTLSVAGNLAVLAGTHNLANTAAVTGTTSVSGTLGITSATGTKTFTGAVTINSGGSLSETVAELITYGGNVTINNGGTLTEFGAATMACAGNFQNDGTYTASTGVHTFSGATKTFSGANPIVIPSVTVSGTYQNNGTLTIATTLAGAGTLTNTGTLNIGAASVTPTLNATAAGNIVNYNRAGIQTIKATTYHHLTLSGTSAKTAAAGLTVNGDFTLSGSASFTAGAFTHNFAGNWIVNTTAATPLSAVTTSLINFNTPSPAAATSMGGTTTATIAFADVSINNTSGVTFNDNASFSAGTTPTLTVSAGATLTPAAGVIISGTGTLTGSGTAQVTRITAGTANFSSQYTIATKTLTNLTVEYIGTAAQTVSVLTYGSASGGGLKINNSSGVSLTASTTVAGTLTLASGIVSAGASTLISSGDCTTKVVRSGGHVAGTLQLAFPTGAPSCTFHVGDATAYRPINASFASVTAAGSLAGAVSQAAGEHPNIATSGLDAAKDVNRYWTLTNPASGTIAFTTYTATFNFINPSDFDAGAVPANFEIERWDGTAWNVTTLGSATSTSTSASGLPFFAASSSNSFALGEKSPATVVSINRAAADPTNAASVSWTVIFSRSVTGVNSGNFTLVPTGLGGTPAITLVSGSGTTWTVTASTGTGSGTLGLNMTSTTGVSPAITGLPFTGQVYTLDRTAPTVISIARAGPSPTAATSVSWNVTFSESVTGVGTADFSLVQGGSVSGATITGVVGGGTAWTVTAGSYTGTGTLGLNLVDDDTIVDAANNPLGGTGVGNGNFSGETYTIVAPITVTRSPGACTNETGIGTQAWSTLTGPLTSDDAYATASVDGTITNFLQCVDYGFNIPAGATINGITVNVERKSSSTNNGGSQDAAMRAVKAGVIGTTDKSTFTTYTTADVVEAHGGAADLWGTTWAPADINDANFGAAFAATKASAAGAAHTISVDHMPISVSYLSAYPAVQSIARASTNPTETSTSVSWTVTFSESVTGVDVADFALVEAGGATGASITGVSGGGTTWTVTADTGTGAGTLGLNLVDNDTIVNALSTPLGGAGADNGNYTGEVYTISAPVAGAFNACNVGTTCTNTTPSTYVRTKLAGAAFSLDLVALKADGSRNTSYNNNVLVELLDSSDNSGALDADKCRPSWTVIATLVPNPAFAPADNGLIAVGTFTLANAYPNVRVRVTNDGGPSRRGCSTDNFAIRPLSLSVSSTDANADGAGSNVNATPAVKAGANFSLTATAIAGYNGTPQINASLVDAHAGAVATVAPSGTFTAANPVSGVATGAAFTYSEVGYFRFQAFGVFDSSFTVVDQPSGCRTTDTCDCTDDFSNSLSGGRYGCDFGNTASTVYFGRFIPDHFALTPGDLIDRAGINTGGSETCASSFSYMGEDFKTTFTLVAQNATNATTANYTGGHAKFGLTTWGNYAFTASSGTLQQGTAAPSGSWSNGSAGVTAAHKIQRSAAAPVAPYTGLTISAQPSYSDDAQTVQLAASTQVHASNTEIRYGRLRLSNAFGTASLQVPMQLQYWGGNSWVLNSADSCTVFPLASVGLTGAISPTVSCVSSPINYCSGSDFKVVGGISYVKLTATATASGSIYACEDLGADPSPGPGTVCSATSAGMSFLQGRWPPGTSYDNDPVARATFGVYSPETRKTIHIRELY